MANAIYDTIGENYNLTRRADKYIAGKIASALADAKCILDIGCGTGNYTLALADERRKLFGADPSEKMLELAKNRDLTISWHKATAENLPFDNGFFDGVFGTLTLHHWNNLPLAFSELNRVLQRCGKAFFFTATPDQMRGYWLNHYFPRMMEKSIKQMPSFDLIQRSVVNAGFKMGLPEAYFVADDLEDHFLYVGKNRPELYFDEATRAGISSFAALENSEEVAIGLKRLKKDLQNGNFAEVQREYENIIGDYLFITMIK